MDVTETRKFIPLTTSQSNALRIAVAIATILVVVRHAYCLEGYCTDEAFWHPFLNYNCLIQRTVNVFTAQAVPVFFFMSAFLFFMNTNSCRNIAEKLKKRIKTLLIPYLLWNLIYVIINFLFSSSAEPFKYNTFTELLKGFSIAPALGVFWYIRTLIVFLLISPLVFWSFKSKISTMFVLVIAGKMWKGVDLQIFSTEGFLFFYMGGICAYYRIYEHFSLIKKPLWLLFGWIFCIAVILFRLYRPSIQILWNINILLSVYLLLESALYLSTTKFGKFLLWLNSHAMFLYALHIFSFMLLGLFVSDLPHTSSNSMFIFIMRCIVGCIFPVLCSILLKKFLPPFHSLLTGGRG